MDISHATNQPTIAPSLPLTSIQIMQYPNVVILLEPTILRKEPRTPAILEQICNECQGTFYFVTDFKQAVAYMQDPNMHLLISYYENKHWELYNPIPPVLFPFPKMKWIHLDHFPADPGVFNRIVNENFANLCTLPPEQRHLTRPLFSVFTTCYKSFQKILRVRDSLLRQTLQNWEWVVIDDSNDPEHFAFLKTHLLGVGGGDSDKRIRLLCGAENNGSIGNMKNMAVGMCRGKYVLEMDHDDEIMPYVLSDAYTAFEEHPGTAFVYMDCANVHESSLASPAPTHPDPNTKNDDLPNNRAFFWLGNEICKGYGAYYLQKVPAGKEHGLCANKWVLVYNTPNINNITLSHLVCCPNHPRMWNREWLMKVGNFCEHLPICDDYEVLMRSMVASGAGAIIKIDKLGYIQYMNEGDNNFSIIRNAEINRIGPMYLQPFGFHNYHTVAEMEKRGAREDDKWYTSNTPMWRRGEEYVHRYCNLRLRPGTKEQVFIYTFRAFQKMVDEQSPFLLHKEGRDVFVVETEGDFGMFTKTVDILGTGFYMRGYVLPKGTTEVEALMYVKHCVAVLARPCLHLFGFQETLVERHFPVPAATSATAPSLDAPVVSEPTPNTESELERLKGKRNKSFRVHAGGKRNRAPLRQPRLSRERNEYVNGK